jgi:hypothetical protein
VATQRRGARGHRRWREGDRLEIVKGLAKGELLIVQGAHLLRDGNPLKIVQGADAEAAR